MKTLAIAGAGGHGRVVADLATLCGWTPVFFDDTLLPQAAVLSWTCQGSTAALIERAAEFDGLIVAIGNNATRLSLSMELQRAGGHLATLLHPSAVVSKHARLGLGSVVMPNAVIMTGAELGNAVIINTAASVDHDCRVGDGVHVSPGARLCGGVVVGDLAWIGAGATVIPAICIGASAVVGAGSVVIRQVEANVTVTGNPARQLIRN